jgi:hypothetical protein
MDFATTTAAANPNWFVVMTLTAAGIGLLVGGSIMHRKRRWPLVRLIGVRGAAVCFWFVITEFEMPPW